MDVATIVLTASLVIIVLQVVSIILIVKNKKVTLAKPEAAPAQPAQHPYEQRDFRKRRDENRFNRRPGFEQKQKPVAPQPPKAVDYVENSLRDINLKLKNAERDQENARRRIREETQGAPQQSNGGQPSPRRFDNNQNRPPRGRDDDFRRRDRHGRPNNNQFRDNRDRDRDRDQNRPPEMERPPVEQVNQSNPLPVSMPPEAARPQPVMNTPVVPVPPVVEKDVISAVPENTEIFHGRKVLVRRRILTPEEQAAKNASDAASGAPSTPAAIPENQASAPATSNPDPGVDEAEPISFGR
jgi:hypothetical protein